MYRHKSTHKESIITVPIGGGNHVVFTPGKIITLNRVYKELEGVGIICLNPEEKKEPELKIKHGKKMKDEEELSLGGD